MGKKKLLVMCATIVALLVTPTALPAQATVTRAVSASAGFHTTDTNGCNVSYWSVTVRRDPSRTFMHTTEVYAVLRGFDYCRSERTALLFTDYQPTYNGNFTVNSSLTAASFRASFYMHDVYGGNVSHAVTVDIHWGKVGGALVATGVGTGEWPGAVRVPLTGTSSSVTPSVPCCSEYHPTDHAEITSP